MDFTKVKKTWCDGVNVNHAPGILYLALSSGVEGDAYMLPINLAKFLHKALGDHLDRYEKEFGSISDEGVEGGAVSPIQA